MRHRHRIRTRMAKATATHDYSMYGAGGPRCGVCDRALPSERCGEDFSVGSHPGVLAGIVRRGRWHVPEHEGGDRQGTICYGHAIRSSIVQIPRWPDVHRKSVGILEAFARVYYQDSTGRHTALPAALSTVYHRRFSDLVWQPLAITNVFDVQPCPHSAGVYRRHPTA
jgi:hypothetical protein